MNLVEMIKKNKKIITAAIVISCISTVIYAVVTLLILLVAAFFVGLLIEGREFENKLDKIESEVSEIPSYFRYNVTVVDGGYALDLSGYRKKWILPGHQCSVFAVIDDECWYLCESSNEDGSKTWYIVSVSMDGRNYTERYSGEFCSAAGADDKHDYRVFHPSCSCNSCEELNSFYFDGKIILTDHVKLVEYDVYTKEAKEFAYSEYDCSFETEISARVSLDHQQITFTKGGEEKILDLETAKESSKSLSEIVDICSGKTLTGRSRTRDIFQHVSVINGKVYITGRVQTYFEEIYFIILEYDFESNSVSYVHCDYHDDSILTLIPRG